MMRAERSTRSMGLTLSWITCCVSEASNRIHEGFVEAVRRSENNVQARLVDGKGARTRQRIEQVHRLVSFRELGLLQHYLGIRFQRGFQQRVKQAWLRLLGPRCAHVYDGGPNRRICIQGFECAIDLLRNLRNISCVHVS